MRKHAALLPITMRTIPRPRKGRPAIACLVKFCTFAARYGSNVLIPQLVETFFGYDAYTAGLFAMAAFTVIPLVLLMRRSVSEKGAAAGMH
jgi:hypothetical protein